MSIAAAWSNEASPTAGGKAAAAALKRDSDSCHAHANIDACYDAIRWNPNDPALLVALADAFVLAKRPADAVRNYRRAAALAPQLPGLAAKLSAAESLVSAKRTPRKVTVDRAASITAPAARFSNSAPETQSH